MFSGIANQHKAEF